MKCFQLTGKDKICEGCLGNEALKENMGKRKAAWQEKLNMFYDSYWFRSRDKRAFLFTLETISRPYVKEGQCE